MFTKILIHLFAILLLFVTFGQGQKSNVVEGGKTLVELIKVIKTPKQNLGSDARNNPPAAGQLDSCAIKNQSDLCFKNSTPKSVAISIYRRNGDGYEFNPFTMKVLSKKQECWFALKEGIYKYRLESDENGMRLLIAEGEFKLEACDNMVRDITN